MNFRDRFAAALRYAGMNQRGLAGALKLENAQNITHWLSRGGVSKRWQFEVCNVLGVNVEWLQAGKGAMLPDEQQQNFKAQTRAGHNTAKSLIKEAHLGEDRLSINAKFAELSYEDKARVEDLIDVLFSRK